MIELIKQRYRLLRHYGHNRFNAFAYALPPGPLWLTFGVVMSVTLSICIASLFR